MGDITHFLDDVTRFSPIWKTDRDRHMELGPKTQLTRLKTRFKIWSYIIQLAIPLGDPVENRPTPSGVQQISASSWYQTTNLPLFVLLDWSILYTLYFTVGYLAFVFNFPPVFDQVHWANFTLTVSSSRALTPSLEKCSIFPSILECESRSIVRLTLSMVPPWQPPKKSIRFGGALKIFSLLAL